ncbi:hypothetical protein ACUH9Y_03070 [Dermabacteraceae bacterium P13115]
MRNLRKAAIGLASLTLLLSGCGLTGSGPEKATPTPETAKPKPSPAASAQPQQVADPKPNPPVPGAFPGAGTKLGPDTPSITALYSDGSGGPEYAVVTDASGRVGCLLSADGKANCGSLDAAKNAPQAPDGEHLWWLKFDDTGDGPTSGVLLTINPSQPEFAPGQRTPTVIKPGESGTYRNFACGAGDEGLSCWDQSTGMGVFMRPGLGVLDGAYRAFRADKPIALTQQAAPSPVALPAGAYPGAGGPIPANAKPITAFTDAQSKGTAILVTPSGNIGCDFYADGQAGCGVQSFITDNLYPAGPEDAAWWVDLSEAGVPGIFPKGDAPAFIAEAPGKVAPYGSVYRHGDYACASEKNGLTCWNAKTGHGAFMNRSGYYPF